MVKVTLLDNHTHARTAYSAGDTISVPEHVAEAMYISGIAKKPSPKVITSAPKDQSDSQQEK